MSRNSMGQRLVLSSFGEANGQLIGAMLDGCPAGMELSEADIQPMLDRRRPGQSILYTQRKEGDVVRIISGTYRGRTTGAPIAMIMENQDTPSTHYELLRAYLRPGHADYTAMIKYGRFNDIRGSGRFSGRITATYVMAGAIARKLLRISLGVETRSYVQSIGTTAMPTPTTGASADAPRGGSSGSAVAYDDAAIYGNDVRCPDPTTAAAMRETLLETKRKADSIGGVVQSVTTGVPVGLGEPIFGSLESDISSAMFSIPSVKGVEFGSGFAGSKLYGSENNDTYALADDHDGSGGSPRIITRTNNSGGILGGISNGMPITMRVAFKPVPSLLKEQPAVNVDTMSEAPLTIKGRFDPCAVPRAPPIVDALVSLVIADHALVSGHMKPVFRDES